MKNELQEMVQFLPLPTSNYLHDEQFVNEESVGWAKVKIHDW